MQPHELEPDELLEMHLMQQIYDVLDKKQRVVALNALLKCYTNIAFDAAIDPSNFRDCMNSLCEFYDQLYENQSLDSSSSM